MLEIIAMSTMLIDHVGAVFFPQIVVLRIIGRASFPIYCFMLARGYENTSNFGRYLGRLLLLALVSQPLYMKLFNSKKLNVVFTLFVCLLVLKLLETPKFHQIIVSISLAMILSFGFEYGMYAVSLVLVYRYIKNPYSMVFAHILINLAYFTPDSWLQQFSIFGSIIIALLFLKKIPSTLMLNRTFYRLFYPLHLTFLLFLKMSFLN